MKIGELVRLSLPAIAQWCENDPIELENLMDANYSKWKFGLNFPFFVLSSEILPWNHSRFWSQEYVIRGMHLRVCSQWYSQQWELVSDYLGSNGLLDVEALAIESDYVSSAVPPRRSPRRGDWSDSYRDWLISKGHSDRSISSRIANARRVEEFYGDLDDHYAKDRLAGLITALRYSTQDERRGRPNPTLIPINGNLRTNLATYTSSIVLYGHFVRSGWRETEFDLRDARSQRTSMIPDLSSPFERIQPISSPVSRDYNQAVELSKSPAQNETVFPAEKMEQFVSSKPDPKKLSVADMNFFGFIKALFGVILLYIFGDQNRYAKTLKRPSPRPTNFAETTTPIDAYAEQPRPIYEAQAGSFEIELEHPEKLRQSIFVPPVSETYEALPRPVREYTGHRHEDGAVDRETIRRWASRPDSNVHQIISIAFDCVPASRQSLVEEIERLGVSRNAYGAIASLMTNKGNAYGRIFVEQAGVLHFHRDIVDVINRYRWIHDRSR